MLKDYDFYFKIELKGNVELEECDDINIEDLKKALKKKLETVFDCKSKILDCEIRCKKN